MTDSKPPTEPLLPRPGDLQSEADEKPAGNRWVSIGKSLLRTCLLTYALVLILMVTFESRLVYPGAYMDVPPSETQSVTRVEYQSADGTQLSGQLFHHPDAVLTDDKVQPKRPVILYFHGNGLTAAYESQFIAELGRRLGAHVMAAEYRGYDSLAKTPNEQGVIADSLAARDFLCKHYDVAPDSLAVMGQSLGGGCAVAVAADSGAQLLVLDRTFDRMVDVAANRYWFIPVKLLMQNRYDSVKRIANYDGPLIQIHGTTDKLVPIEHGRRLHEAANCEPKYMIEVNGMGHNDPMPIDTWSTVLTRMKELMAARP